VPNGVTDSANINNTSGSNSSVNLDMNATVNRVQFKSTGTQWNISGGAFTLTFAGTNPRIEVGAVGGQITNDISLSANLTLDVPSTSTNGLILRKITAASKTITQSNNGEVTYLINNAATITGGTYYLDNGKLSLGVANPLGNAGGMTIVWSNANPTIINNQITTQTFLHPITINNTTSNAMTMKTTGSSTTFTFSGAMSGNLTGPLTSDNGGNLGVIALSGDLSGVTWSGSGALYHYGTSSTGVCSGCAASTLKITGTAVTTLSATMPIILGNTVNGYRNSGLTGNQFWWDSSGTFPNPISVRGSTTTAQTGYTSLNVNSGATVSGNIVLNTNASTRGDVFRLNGTSTYTGIISKSAGSDTDMTIAIFGNITFTNANTATNNVTLENLLNVTGSTQSTLTTIASNATLAGNGSVKAVTNSAGFIKAYDNNSPATTDILTINGNLTESGACVHTFQVGAANASSKLQVNGNVTLAGTVSQTTRTGGTFEILNYTGTRTNSWTTPVPGGSITNDDGNKKVILTVTATGTVSWIGLTAGTWQTTTNWNPAWIPNDSGIIVNINTDQGAGAKTIAMGTTVPATINQLNFINATSDWTITGTSPAVLTFDGTSPVLNATHLAAISAPIALGASDLAITGNANITLGVFNANGKNITNTNTADIILSGTMSNATGVLYHQGKGLRTSVVNATPDINWTNTVSGTYISAVGTIAKNIIFNDTGANTFELGSSTQSGGVWTGSNFSGTITHDLIVRNSCNIFNTWTGFTFSGGARLIIAAPSLIGVLNPPSGGFPSAATISVGDGATTSTSFQTFLTPLASPIVCRPSTTTAGVITIYGSGASQTFSNGITLNSDSNCVTGSIVDIVPTANIAATISGVISNASNAANVTLRLTSSGAGSITLSNTNTYTSPTSITATASVVNVTGSIGSTSLITLSGTTVTLKGSGTVGPVTTAGASPKIEARSITAPSSSQVLTINGALNETVATVHTFETGAANASSKIVLSPNFNATLSGTVTTNPATPAVGTYTLLSVSGTGTITGTWTTAIVGGSISVVGQNVILTKV
jgi:hypothetical protein